MRPHAGAALVVALLALVLCASATGALARGSASHAHGASSVCPGTGLRPTAADTATIDAATLCLIDHARSVHGLRALSTNHELQAVAVSQVKDMVRLDYFSDDRPSGTTPTALIAATRYGKRSRSLSTAENIGWGTGLDATPAQMVAAWMQSPAHREIILTGAFRSAGVGAMPAVPSRLGEGQPGATYALELAAR